MIVIHQMLKVASRAWVQAARGSTEEGRKEPQHVHFLSPRNLERIAAIGAIEGPRQTISKRILLREILRSGPSVRDAIAMARRRGVPVRVMTGMRDPIARSLSLVHFFADFYGDTSRPLDRFQGGDGETTAAALADWWAMVHANEQPGDSFAQLMTLMIGAYRTWFTDETEEILGVPLGPTPFPVGAGAERLAGDGIEGFLYRIEDMAAGAPARPRLMEQAADFLGVPRVDPPLINTAAQRRSFPRYQAARAALQLDPTIVAQVYASPIVRRFYSPEEIAIFADAWNGNRSG